MVDTMCGRFSLSTNDKALAKQFALQTLPKLLARYNITPAQPVFAIRENSASKAREGTFLNWGLIPFWAKDISIGPKLTNARAETAAEKPAFRGPIRHHRCLIPATGFYEWQRQGKHRHPYLFRQPDHGVFAMAGLWEHWGSPDGSEIETCTILTTAANAVMAPIHHRMPVLIASADFASWLNTEIQQSKKIAHLLHPPSAAALIAHPVSDAVNHPANDSPNLIQPVDPPPEPPAQSDFFERL